MDPQCCNEPEGDGGSRSNDGNNDQVHVDPLGGPHRLRRSRRHHGPVGPQGAMIPVVPALNECAYQMFNLFGKGC